MDFVEYCRKYVRVKCVIDGEEVTRGLSSWELDKIEHLQYGEFMIVKTRRGDRIVPVSRARFKKARAKAKEGIICPNPMDESLYPVSVSGAYKAGMDVCRPKTVIYPNTPTYDEFSDFIKELSQSRSAHPIPVLFPGLTPKQMLTSMLHQGLISMKEYLKLFSKIPDE